MTQSASPSRRCVPPISRLSGVDVAALSKQREARWRPGLTDQPLHSEIFASARDGSGAGLALALARDALSFSGAVAGQGEDALAEAEDLRQVLWVQDKRAVQMNGRPYLHGLPEDWRERVICVEASTPEDALFALEEGLKCRDLMCVIGEIAGNPRALDFTASRRLSLTAEKHGVALWLVRLEAQGDLSSARMRWRARPDVSETPRWNAAAPGEPMWQAELFRARSHAPGEWKLGARDGRLRVEPKPQSRPQRPSEYAPNVTLPKLNRPQKGSAHSSDLVRATFGRSLAAVARG
ncbi:recA-like protein [Erythrobacter sp. SCSIO 43205]|uniref:recA-like protein n=1 Tax=Erythrobacter sp. SCSIO 43205 TaxID=2779361 RepID=UPI001CA96029|nr:recA-like protein [Erythrobacter sp. SCSIO 43205]UAB77034.1 recA-like protein [Erythrobacter sp. SCSIO 43205]